MSEIEIGVGSQRAVRAERCFVTDGARPCIDASWYRSCWCQKTLRQFVGDVIFLGGQLPRAVERHCIGTMLVDDGAIAPRQIVHRPIPGRALEGPVLQERICG